MSVDVNEIKSYIEHSGFKQRVIAEKSGLDESKLSMSLQGKRKLEAGEYGTAIRRNDIERSRQPGRRKCIQLLEKMINGELIIDNFAGGGGASTDLHSMNQIITDYPIGTKVRLESDRPDEAPREVAGYRKIGRYDYLIFTDGYMAFVGRVVKF